MSTSIKPIRAVTSASNLFRRALCPGSGTLEAKFAEVESEYSVEGTLLHSLFMLSEEDWPPLPAPLDAEQREALESANFQATDFIRQFREDFGIPEDADAIVEREVALILKDRGSELFPGHADYVITWPAHSARCVIDAKFGFMEVDDAADNLQLATYAVMRGQRSPVNNTGVAIVQPRNFGPKRSGAAYSGISINNAFSEIVRVFHESEKPDAPRNPSLKACHFCRAKAACDEYKAKFMQLSPELHAAIVTIDNDQLVRMNEGVSFALKIKDEVRDEMRARIRAGKLTGWKLVNTGETRKLSDGIGLWRAISSRFPEVKDFATRYNRCLEIRWGALEELWAHLTGVSEAKAKEHVKAIAAPFVETKEKEKRIALDAPKKK